MRKPALYSRSRRGPDGALPAGDAAPATTPAPTRRRGLSSPRVLWSVIALLAVMLALSLGFALRPTTRTLTQKDIDAAVLKTLETTVLPSPAAAAYETISPSVVRVMAFGKARNDRGEFERGVGTGVVIVDKGVILTSLHVVQDAETVRVVFFDGLMSRASVISTQPENDLAVLQASTVPDDLMPATLRSTADLAPGDQVIAVGFPFGIGPSASAGVVSGLNRVFRSPNGGQELSNLIQFDAAANPGNSGGPLVTMDGAVVGIVTAILNPTPARTFIGIGFAVPIENAASAVGMSPF
ncbi:MAG: trypsin-like peptidase domain-containing protein [Rhodoferax sp.]|nr:trypsin-like peptidase domain-containing protein [Rhodoferax sp.]